MAAVDARELPGRAVTGPGEGGDDGDGDPLVGHASGAHAAARRRAPGAAADASPRPRARRWRRTVRRGPGLGRDRLGSLFVLVRRGPSHPVGRGGGRLTALFETPGRPAAISSSPSADPSTILADLEAGRLRAAEPDPSASDGWRVRAEVKAAILATFADRTTTDWQAGPLTFRDRAALGPRDDLAGGPWRIVPGGTAVRRGAYLGEGVIVMPPSYVNVGAWVGEGTMVDSHVLIGSCAQIGARVHLSAGVTIGGVLEPPGARPVIVEDDAFVGAGSALLEGVLIGQSAVIGAGVTLTGTSRLYDLVRDRVIEGTTTEPLVVPAGAVVVPGARTVGGSFAASHGLSVTVALLVKDR